MIDQMVAGAPVAALETAAAEAEAASFAPITSRLCTVAADGCHFSTAAPANACISAAAETAQLAQLCLHLMADTGACDSDANKADADTAAEVRHRVVVWVKPPVQLSLQS